MMYTDFWELIQLNVDLPFDIEDVKNVESNCGSTWIDLENGDTYSITITKTEG